MFAGEINAFVGPVENGVRPRALFLGPFNPGAFAERDFAPRDGDTRGNVAAIGWMQLFPAHQAAFQTFRGREAGEFPGDVVGPDVAANEDALPAVEAMR